MSAEYSVIAMPAKGRSQELSKNYMLQLRVGVAEIPAVIEGFLKHGRPCAAPVVNLSNLANRSMANGLAADQG
jgi:hypothetical protein